MHGHSLGRSFADRAAADVLRDLLAVHRHHGDGRSGGEPVGFVVSAGVVAHFIDVAVNERHGAEARQTRASKTWKKNQRSGSVKYVPKAPAHTQHASGGGQDK